MAKGKHIANEDTVFYRQSIFDELCKMDDYPCQYCRMEQNPLDCGVGCDKWRRWFSAAWRNMQANGISDQTEKIVITQANVFDKKEIIENCTVEIWENSVTGECSVGWYRNEGEEINAAENDQSKMH